MSVLLNDVLSLLNEVLQIDSSGMNESTTLIGAMPEFDSMGLVSVLTAIEQKFGIDLDNQDISAETFETIGTLVDFIRENLSK